ncbi:hypothetical protein [Ideonella sp.]|uniref:hypothetical protein n=1 Tax=Ideonella sp. TaxID=1929293 RepID=UPI002E2ECACE|nr:hypothetical protein [Ideonella sp.]
MFTECQLSTISGQGTRSIDGKFLSWPVTGMPRLGREWSRALRRALVRRGAADNDSVKGLQGARGLIVPSLCGGVGPSPVEAMVRDCSVHACDIAARPETCGGAASQVDRRGEGAPSQAVARLLATLQA